MLRTSKTLGLAPSGLLSHKRNEVHRMNVRYWQILLQKSAILAAS